MRNIIAFMAEFQSGKDYFCAHLGEKIGAQRLSFSDEVRRIAHDIFPWFPFDIDPALKDVPYIHPMNPKNLTPRDILLTVGKLRDVESTLFVRKFGEKQYQAALDNPTVPYIITDFRTPDEWDFIKNKGIPVIKIIRHDRTGLEPNWFEEFVRGFEDYDAKYINYFDGVARFDQFFEGWLCSRNMTVFQD